MRRHCGRPGCSALATVTFSFDAAQCVVWLNPISEGAPRAGDLCTRHADAMAPPKGWERIDRRVSEEVPQARVATSVPPAPTAPSVPAPTAESSVLGSTPSAPSAPPVGDDLLPQRPAPKRKRRKRWDEVPSLFAGESATNAQPELQPDLQPALQSESTLHNAGNAATVAEPLVGSGTSVAESEADAGVPTTVDDAPAEGSDVSWLPRFATSEDLDRVLEASTPMLARAFRNARPLEVDETARESPSDAPVETPVDAPVETPDDDDEAF